ncbi:hypothetical protein [Nocardia sp. NPDC050175]|uniref:hypothetical protein n=1 Tax=Nocardia sp. NPDC050175 TaxID=3364317 RepID=UPI00379E8CD9
MARPPRVPFERAIGWLEVDSAGPLDPSAAGSRRRADGRGDRAHPPGRSTLFPTRRLGFH